MPKYALPEIERRWLVKLADVGSLEAVPYTRITDLYVEGTQLRLRKMERDGEVVYKFCKKYGKVSALSEPITNLYLSEAEYTLLAALPGAWLHKRRYVLEGGALDVLDTSEAFFEVEFASEDAARAYQAPAFVGLEVTGENTSAGAKLAVRDGVIE